MPISARLSVHTDARSAQGCPDLLSCASQHATIRAALQYCAARRLEANAVHIANQPRSAPAFRMRTRLRCGAQSAAPSNRCTH